MPTMPMEKMHQGANQQNQIGPHPQGMSPMLAQQIEGKDQNHCRNRQNGGTSPEGARLVLVRSVIRCVIHDALSLNPWVAK